MAVSVRRNDGLGQIDITGISAGDNLTVTLDSVAQFRASSGIPSEAVSITIRGYYGPNTPGGGELLIDRADTITVDDGGTVFVNADGLRIKRSIGEEILTSWFGFYADGVTDNSAKKNTIFALALNQNKGVWFNQPGTYYFTSNDTATNANITHGQTFQVRGGPNVKIKTSSGSVYFIDFNTNGITANLTADLNRGDRLISIDDSTIKNGDILHLLLVNVANNSQIVWEQLFGVTLDNDGNIYAQASKFFFPSADPYTLPDGTTELKTRVSVYKNTPNFIIKDFEFTFDLVGDNTPANKRLAIEMHGGNVHLENLKLSTNRDATAAEQGGFYNLPTIILWRYGKMTAKNIEARNSGYTIWCQWCQSALIEGIKGENIRHFVTLNNTHDVTVKDAYVNNGGVMDAHGSWGYKAINVNSVNPTTDPSDNVRGFGPTTIIDSSFTTTSLLLSSPPSTYIWPGYTSNSLNHQFFIDNLASTLTIKNTYVSGYIQGGHYNRNQSYTDVVCGGLNPGETSFVSGLTDIGRTVILSNVKDHANKNIILPKMEGGNARLNTVTDVSNPLGEVPSWFVDAASSANGNDTYVGLLDCWRSNPGKHHKWQMSDVFYKRIYGRQDTDPNSITLVLIVSWSGFPYVSQGQSRLIQLRPYGRLVHDNGLDSSNTDYQDYASLVYSGSGVSILENFSQSRGGGTYIPLTINGIRSTQSSVGGGPQEPLPTEIAGYTGLHRIELDIDIDVRQTNGSLSFGIEGTTQFYSLT